MLTNEIKPLTSGKKDLLRWEVYANRKLMGRAAALAVAQKIREIVAEKREVNIIFASAPSQEEFLAELARIPGLEWFKVNAFHMDEYIGLPEKAPQRFSVFLKERLFDKVRPGRVFYIDGNNDPEVECYRYSELLKKYPVDISCMGIGENGHLAFNDPPVADFNDPVLVKKVLIDMASRFQQVHDGCFAKVEDVPEFALTLTIPALLQASFAIAVVPGTTKREAIKRIICEEISEKCPATILRRHPNSILFLDRESAALLTENN